MVSSPLQGAWSQKLINGDKRSIYNRMLLCYCVGVKVEQAFWVKAELPEPSHTLSLSRTRTHSPLCLPYLFRSIIYKGLDKSLAHTVTLDKQNPCPLSFCPLLCSSATTDKTRATDEESNCSAESLFFTLARPQMLHCLQLRFPSAPQQKVFGEPWDRKGALKLSKHQPPSIRW